ncbi:ABC transporter permease [Konateibacter massiliensis]|uniref:ABC transporter permease n=1 Tax=Konateibacter massiliensis TaxID=2002841 RepID=UPI000C160356|nr:FtsX-like permease family protein [Konateibacter massiliensis]
MLKYFLIAKNNIKRGKASAITLLLLVAIATILLYSGIQVMSQMGGFVDEKNRELNGTHTIVIADRALDGDIENIFKEIEGFSYMEREDGVIFSASKFQNTTIGEEELGMPSLFLNYDTSREISKLKVIDEADERYENTIIVPYVLKAVSGYKTGDTFKLYVDDKETEFRIGGFYEDVIFASATNLMMYKFYVYDGQFHAVSEEKSAIKCSVNCAILKNIEDAEQYETQMLAKINEKIADTSKIYLTTNYQSIKIGVSVFAIIIMSVLLAFSGIILFISMIVIRFSMTNHIEDNMKNIGMMEAAGYTAKQLVRANILEYGITATLGFVLGFLISMGISPFITKIVSSSIGLKWISHPDLLSALLSFVIIICLVLGIAYMGGRKIKKITPLIALRSGIETHNFKKNRIPLDKTRLNVNVAISMKEFLYNKRENVVASVIIMLLSVVCVLSLTLYYNFVIDDTVMRNLVGLENAEVEIIAVGDSKAVYEEIGKMEEVARVSGMDSFQTAIKYKGKETNPHFQVTEDYGTLRVKTLIKGRMPEHDNEISVTKLVLGELGAEIGDTVSVEYNGISKEYLIVGITQHISYLGKGAEITTAGMKRLVPEFESTTAMVYLKEGVDTAKFITKLNGIYENKDVQAKNNEETWTQMMRTFSIVMRVVSIGCLAVAAVIIVFIMFLVVRARVAKERMRMGISKALGFTSNQLIGHILISQIPVIVFSSLIGAIVGYYTTNPMIALSLAGNGILKTSFYVDVSFVIVTPIGISLLGFLTVIAVSLKIRGISAIGMLE